MVIKKKRVTEIIGEIHPFYKKTFEDSLAPAGIKKKKEKGNLIPGGLAERHGQLDYDAVMDRLCAFGTQVNLWFNDYCAGFEMPVSDKFMVPYVEGAKKWLEESKAEMVDYDFVVDTQYYIGSGDAVMLIDGEYWLIDLKTYDAYKYLFGIKDDIIGKKGQPKLSSSNRKKVTLQTSMYRAGYSEYPITKQGVLWITQYGTFLIELEYDLSEFDEWVLNQNVEDEDVEYGKFKCGV